MENTKNHIILVAGEASGDLHGAHLVNELKKQDSSLTFSGLGGRKMEDAGVDLYYDLTTIAVVGFWEVLKNYKEFKRIFNLTVKQIEERNPACVVLIDYPGFNLRLAKILKQKGIKVIYYISPQVWAWKESRVKQIKENVDAMLVLFKFEIDFYKKYNMEVEFVGHPLMDAVQTSISSEKFLASINFDSSNPTIALLPGSREKEIESLLPVMLKATDILKTKIPHAQFVIVQAPTIHESLIAKYLDDPYQNIRVVSGNHYNAINACNFCIVASGTATLETAILQKPMVVVYKTSPLTYFLAKTFVKIPNIGLVNVVAGKRVVPECVQHEATAQNIAEHIEDIASNELKLAEIKNELKKVKESLGEPGASARAAQAILKRLN